MGGGHVAGRKSIPHGCTRYPHSVAGNDATHLLDREPEARAFGSQICQRARPAARKTKIVTDNEMTHLEGSRQQLIHEHARLEGFEFRIEGWTVQTVEPHVPEHGKLLAEAHEAGRRITRAEVFPSQSRAASLR